MPLVIALVSSLPMLEMEGASYMTVEKFLSYCEGNLPEKEVDCLRSFSPLSDPALYPAKSFAGKYLRWEGALRNACVKLRAGKKKLDPAHWMEQECSSDPSAESAASAAFAAADPLLREKVLDTARWNMAEELTKQEMYSLNVLYAYKLKLELRAKWLARVPEQAAENLDAAAEKVRGTES